VTLIKYFYSLIKRIITGGFIDTLSLFANAANQVATNLPVTLGFVVLLFAIQILNALIGYRLNLLGIWPRKRFGWIGIPFSPFLHGNFSHLFFNMLPLFIFSNLIMLQGLHVFLISSAWIIGISGLFIFLFARSGIHVGASALIIGYLGYLLIGIYDKPTALSFVVGATCCLYFGVMLTNLLPDSNKQISWEGHVFGFVAGIGTAVLIRHAS
jgi:membrane associated rhomboid family serine protease